MSDIDLTYEEEEKPKKFQTKWFFPMFFQPNKALKEIAEKNYAVWLMPLCLLMLSALILVLVAIVVIAALTILGPIIGNVFTEINTGLNT